MKKLGKGIVRVLCGVILVLVLLTILLLLYPKYAERLGLEEQIAKIQKEEPEKAESLSEEILLEGTEEITKEADELGTDDDFGGLQEHREPKEEAVFSKQQQDTIHQIYLSILNNMGYQPDAVYFYEIKKIDGREFYAFQILDGDGNAYEYLLLSDGDRKQFYWCDSNLQLSPAHSYDVLYTSRKPGKTDVSYKDDDWESVFKGYMTAMLENKDLIEAETYRDDSYYYEARISEKERKNKIDDAKNCQKQLVNKVKQLQEDKEKGKLLSYKAEYNVLGNTDWEDEEGIAWKDVTIRVTLSEEKRKEIVEEEDFYQLSLRKYEYGWRIATIKEMQS